MSVDNNTPLDPRVQVELEKLNTATDNINKYEVELDEAKSDFKKILAESVEKIKQSAHKLGNSIQVAKPYYEARLYVSQLAKETQSANNNFEKARSVHAAAKEMVYLAEQGLGEKSTLDTACQEMLSHAASRVNQSQIDCTEARNLLKICELKQEVANNRVAKLQAQLKSAIRSSRPYYETRANYNGILKAQKQRIHDLERRVSDAKISYNDALKNLEQISEEIHKMRQERRSIDYAQDQIPIAHSSQINSTDEYLDFPATLSIKSSPIRQQKLDKLDCPHLLRDIEFKNGTSCSYNGCSTTGNGRCHINDNTKRGDIFSPNRPDFQTNISSDEIEQWTEIRLSNSESSSSGYSQNTTSLDDRSPLDLCASSDSSPSTSEEGKKVTCTTVFGGDNNDNENNDKKKNCEGISTWISKTSLKNTGRRQSLDMLIDASDRVKDVFTQGFQKVGKTLERRNSESEVNQSESNDFFLFRSDQKDALSDEQVENLHLDEDCSDIFRNTTVA